MFPLSSYACSLFVTWPHSLFTEYCPRLHPKIESWVFCKAFCYDGDVPNTNFHNCFLRQGSKCAGGKIRKNKCFQKFNSSLMKWRLQQKLRSEVEMTEINSSSLWNLWHKIRFEWKFSVSENKKFNSMFLGTLQFDTNYLAVKLEVNLNLSPFSVKFKFLQNVWISSIASTI